MGSLFALLKKNSEPSKCVEGGSAVGKHSLTGFSLVHSFFALKWKWRFALWKEMNSSTNRFESVSTDFSFAHPWVYVLFQRL
jgi:hypothetical protein